MALVLVVEDDMDIAASVRDVLEEEGHTVVHARHGQEAMRLLASSGRPCVIVLDLMMPVMDGWAVMAALEKDASCSSIPVVVTSAASDSKIEQMAKAFIRKPYDIDRLLTVVERYCGTLGRPQVQA